MALPHHIHSRDGGNTIIEAGPVGGSSNLAVRTQQLPVGAGIPAHIAHPHLEALHALAGTPARAMPNDAPTPVRRRWHDFHTRGHVARLSQSSSTDGPPVDRGAPGAGWLFSR